MHTLPPAIIDIKHEAPYKVTDCHVSPFNSLFDNLQAQDLKRKEEQKKDTDNKRKEAKRKAYERAVRAKRAEANRVFEESEQERIQASSSASEPLQNGNEQPITNSGAGTQNTEIGATWDSVSPLQASQYMASKTGVSVGQWLGVIYRESSNNPYALNSLGCYGYLQLMQSVHGNVSAWSPQAYLDKAVEIYQTQGAGAWEAW